MKYKSFLCTSSRNENAIFDVVADVAVAVVDVVAVAVAVVDVAVVVADFVVVAVDVVAAASDETFSRAMTLFAWNRFSNSNLVFTKRFWTLVSLKVHLA